MDNDLPEPRSQELRELVHSHVSREIYTILYESRNEPLSISEIRAAMGLKSGEQEHLNRRMRDLYKTFDIERTRRGKETLYKLIGVLDLRLNTDAISNRLRAWVLRDKRCVQCGKTPQDDGVRLHVDHKIPQAWGGTNDLENLQALCSDCNEGKKDLYASYDQYADKLKLAANYDEVHKRIGELLKAFNGNPVASDLIEVVAKSRQYQDDWQKRMRELRELGWQYSVARKKEGDRIRSYYVLEHFEPWPEGNIRAEIRKRELRKKSAN